MLTNPEIILFAIQSGIRLGEQIKKAYTDSLKSRELVLPLPNFPFKADLTSALFFFRHSGNQYARSNLRIGQLLAKNQQDKLTEEEEDELCALHQEIKAIEAARNGDFSGNRLSEQSMTALMTVRQWQRGKDPDPTALKRIAGTLVEIAIDYFVNVPGALNENSAYARALKGFLSAIDSLDFVQTPIERIGERLLVAAIETINENPALLTGDEKTQQYIECVTKSIADELNKQIEKVHSEGIGDLETEERISRWGELVFRSLLNNARETVLSNPGKFLNTDDKSESSMLNSVGKAVMDLVLNDNARLSDIFSGEVIDKVVKASLIVVSKHPEIIQPDKSGFQEMLNQIKSDLATLTQALDPDILPEIICLILEKTSGNLNSLWQDTSSKHLLVIAAKELLQILPQRTGLTKDQVMEILGFIFDEIIQNPNWIVEKNGGEKTALREFLDGVNESISQRSVSSESIVQIFRSAISAAALQRDFIEKVPAGDSNQEKQLITLALDAIFDNVFRDENSPKVPWVLARRDVLILITKSFLNKLAKEGPSQNRIIKLQEILSSEIERFKNREPFSIDKLIERIESADLSQ